MHQKPFGGWGSLQRSPRPSWIKGVASGRGWGNGDNRNKERVMGRNGEVGKGRKGREGKEEESEERGKMEGKGRDERFVPRLYKILGTALVTHIIDGLLKRFLCCWERNTNIRHNGPNIVHKGPHTSARGPKPPTEGRHLNYSSHTYKFIL